MKILLLSELYLPIINGVVTSTSTLSKALCDLGHEVRVLSLEKKKCIRDNIYYNSALCVDKIYPDAYVSLKLDEEIFQDICAWQPDILHTQSEFTTMLFAKKIAKKLNIPIVHTYHTSYEDYTHYIFLPKNIGKAFVAFMLRKILNPVAHIIAPTKKIKDMLLDYNIKKEITTVPTGIDINFPLASEEELAKLRKSLSIEKEKKIFLSLGRIAKEKNIDCLLEYIAQSQKPDWILVIAGGGPYLDALKQRAKALNIEEKVRFTGMIVRDEIYKYYQFADIFISASTSETQGLTYIEALANARPLLCKYDTCLDDVLIPEKNGYFFNSYAEFCVNAIRILNQENNLSLKSFAKTSVTKFSTQIFAKSIEEVYRNSIENMKS